MHSTCDIISHSNAYILLTLIIHEKQSLCTVENLNFAFFFLVKIISQDNIIPETELAMQHPYARPVTTELQQDSVTWYWGSQKDSSALSPTCCCYFEHLNRSFSVDLLDLFVLILRNRSISQMGPVSFQWEPCNVPLGFIVRRVVYTQTIFGIKNICVSIETLFINKDVKRIWWDSGTMSKTDLLHIRENKLRIFLRPDLGHGPNSAPVHLNWSQRYILKKLKLRILNPQINPFENIMNIQFQYIQGWNWITIKKIAELSYLQIRVHRIILELRKN